MKTKSPQCGLIASKWGPCFWMHLHMVAAGFPTDGRRRHAYMRYFKDIGHVLPCQTCRTHYQTILQRYIKKGSYKNKFKSRTVLQNFVWQIHNKINAKLQKPMQKKDILKQYSVAAIESKYRAKC